MFRTEKLENPEKRRRKGILTSSKLGAVNNTGEKNMAANEASGVTNMAASTGKSSGKEQRSKDSPKPNNKSSSAPFGSAPFGSIPGFPVPPSTPSQSGSAIFGAPTYFPNNPWQSDQSNKLDYIVEKLNKIEQNQNSFLVRLGHIENKMTETTIKVTEIETSQVHISQKYDSIDTTTKQNITEIHKLQGDVKNLQKENTTFSGQNAKLKDDVIDLKCRSMRDKLLFFDIPEAIAPVHHGNGQAASFMELSYEQGEPVEQGEQIQDTGNSDINSMFQSGASALSYAGTVQKEEDCAGKVYDFCEKVLNIPNVKSSIKIDRAHRIGVRSAGKTRPIVAKFLMTEHKVAIKTALRNVDLKTAYNGAFKVNDQFPSEVIQ